MLMIWPFNFEARRKARRRRKIAALRETMLGYPLYDPPYKIEERLLPADKAEDNFTYFMSVRLQRLDHFRNWMRTRFGLAIPLDRAGIVTLCDWLDVYGEYLFENKEDCNSFFTTLELGQGNALVAM